MGQQFAAAPSTGPCPAVTIMPFSKVLVIVPAYNESGNVRQTIRDIRRQALPVDIVVVNDGSSDATAQEAREERVTVLSHQWNLGIGATVQTGLLFARRRKYDVAIQVDGDGQHDAQFVNDLIQPILTGQADVVIGSRFLPPFQGYRSSFIRRIGIHFFAWLISRLTGCPVTDPTSGFRAFNQRTLRFFSEYYPQDFPEPEAIVLAQRQGLRVVEIPVLMRSRGSGHSSIRYLKTFHYMVKVTFAIMLDMVKKKRSEV